MDLSNGKQLARQGAILPPWVEQMESSSLSWTQINISTPPIPLNSFKTYSSDALETISIDKALIAFVYIYCAHIS